MFVFSTAEDIINLIQMIEASIGLQKSILLNPVFRHPSASPARVKSLITSQIVPDKKYSQMTLAEQKLLDEKIKEKRKADAQRKEESLLLEKGQKNLFHIGKDKAVKDIEKESMLDDAWKILYQNLIEESILVRDNGIEDSIKSAIKLSKVIEGFRMSASKHLREIIDELSLPPELRLHEHQCTRYYGNSDTVRPANSPDELPTKLVYTDDKYDVTISVPQQIEAGLSLRSHGLEMLVVEDETVLSSDLEN